MPPKSLSHVANDTDHSPALHERTDRVYVEHGQLMVVKEAFYTDGASEYMTLRISPSDQIHLQLVSAPPCPSPRPVQHMAGDAHLPPLAMQLRSLALPLIALPQPGKQHGVDMLVAMALYHLRLRPHLALAH